jgi:hypothetical protein
MSASVTRPLARIRPTRWLIPPALITLLAVGACAGTDAPATPDPSRTADQPANTPTTSEPRRPTGQPATEEPDTVTAIRITVADQTITAQLANNPTAQDLAGQLPLTLTISDFNQVEKVAELPRPLTTDGVPAGADPDINDIGYYAPSRSLVFYYGDVGYFNGIVRIGRLNDRDTPLIEQQPDGTAVMIEPA